MKKYISMLAAVGIAISATSGAMAASKTVKIAWSHYTGWEFLGHMKDSGVLDKWNKKMDTDVQIVFVGAYDSSITLYTTKDYQGVSVTNMDVLAIAGVGGRHSNAIIVGDYSNGNDGVALRGFESLKDVVKANAPVAMVQFTVSHYLLARCAEKVGLNIDQFTITKASDADISAIVKSSKQNAAVSWNPYLADVRATKGVNIVCDSSSIPGEIIDMVVVGDEVDANSRRALVGAWYETIAMVKAGNAKVIEELAKQADGDSNPVSVSVPAFKAQLKTTHMFYDPKDAVAFVMNKKLRGTMKSVIDFSFKAGVYDGVDNAAELGVKFADGSILGNPKKVRLTFDPSIMQEAAAGKLIKEELNKK